jgi:hypothetical protein
MRLTIHTWLLSSMLCVAGCATETEAIDGSAGAIAGAPGPSKDAEKAEVEAKKERVFAYVTRKEVILARYAAAKPGDFLEGTIGTRCLPQSEHVKQYFWDPYRAVTLDPSNADPHLLLDSLQYKEALEGLGFGPILNVIERKMGETYEISIVASQGGQGICSSQGVLYAGARVVLRCEGVAKDSGPSADKCVVPTPGTEDAKPR